MAIALTRLALPTLYSGTANSTALRLRAVSVGVALVLVLLYCLTVVYSLTVSRQTAGAVKSQEDPTWSLRQAVVTLVCAGVLVGVESELLVAGLEAAVASIGLSRVVPPSRRVLDHLGQLVLEPAKLASVRLGQTRQNPCPSGSETDEVTAAVSWILLPRHQSGALRPVD